MEDEFFALLQTKVIGSCQQQLTAGECELLRCAGKC